MGSRFHSLNHCRLGRILFWFVFSFFPAPLMFVCNFLLLLPLKKNNLGVFLLGLLVRKTCHGVSVPWWPGNGEPTGRHFYCYTRGFTTCIADIVDIFDHYGSCKTILITPNMGVGVPPKYPWLTIYSKKRTILGVPRFDKNHINFHWEEKSAERQACETSMKRVVMSRGGASRRSTG